MSAKRLGRGLKALIHSNEDNQKGKPGLLKKEPESISKIQLKHIHPNPSQPRKYFDEQDYSYRYTPPAGNTDQGKKQAIENALQDGNYV